MSPKEKAKKLVDKIYKVFTKGYADNEVAQIMAYQFWFEESKEAAIICVDELINATFVSSKDTVPYDESDKQFWQEVKKEIEKL